MINQIILITEDAVEQLQLAGMLWQQHRALHVIPVLRREALETISPQTFFSSRIVAFCTDIIVAAWILDATGFGAYNFHPAPPRYPGRASAMFAICDEVRRYGATAHVMAPKVDTGAIVGTNMFDVPRGITLPRLERLAYEASLDLFRHFAAHLAADESPLPTIREEWGDRRYIRAAARCERPATHPAFPALQRPENQPRPGGDDSDLISRTQ